MAGKIEQGNVVRTQTVPQFRQCGDQRIAGGILEESDTKPEFFERLRDGSSIAASVSQRGARVRVVAYDQRQTRARCRLEPQVAVLRTSDGWQRKDKSS